MKRNCSFSKLLWQRIKHEYILITLLTICLYVIIADFIDEIKIPCNYSLETICKINKLALNIALSYISAFMFYIITVLFPQTLKAHAILSNAIEKLRFLKDYFYDFSANAWGDDWTKTKDIESIAAAITYKKDEHTLVFKPDFIRLSRSFISISDEYIKAIMSYEQYLTNKECDMLVHIYNEPAFSYMRHHITQINNPLCDEKKLKAFIKDLIHANEDVKQLYTNMSKKIWL